MTLTSVLFMSRYHLIMTFLKIRFFLYKILTISKYNLSVLLFKFRFGILLYFVQLLKRFYISFRLMLRYKNREITGEVSSRYFCYKSYLNNKESKEAYGQLMDFIGEWSKKTGMHQWEIRSLINRDFNIDI